MPLDPNEVFPWLRVCQDPVLMGDVQRTLGERLQAIQTSKLAPGLAQQQQEPHVQPTFETSSGGARAMPLTGPGPAPDLGVDVFQLAEWNRRREEAQKASLRGPGPDPERVEVGPVPEQKAQQAQQIADETSKAVVEKTREAAGGQAPQAGSEQPGGGVPPQPPQQRPQQGVQPPQQAPVATTPHEQVVASRAVREGFPGVPSGGDKLPEQIAPQVQGQAKTSQGKQARMAQRPAPKP